MIGEEKRSVFRLSSKGRPINNHVLVKVDLVEYQKSESGLVLGDATWDNAGHVTRNGVVVAYPKKFCHTGEDGYGAEWKSVIEIVEGDRVFWGLMASWDCPIIQNEEGTFFLVKYEDLIVATFDPEEDMKYMRPLNGYVICTPEYDKRKMSTIELDPVQNKQRASVYAVGLANTEYFRNCGQDAVDVEVGDTVYLFKPFLTALEDPRYAVLDKNLSYVQRRWIIAVNRN